MTLRGTLALICAGIALAGAAVDAGAESRHRRSAPSEQRGMGEDGGRAERRDTRSGPQQGVQDRRRMTTEERERLRRDIDEASRELYTRRRR